MGAWGVGAFENDAASDWLASLEAAIPTTLRSTFHPVVAIEADLYLEEPDASEAVAAAEVVAAMRGKPGGDVRDRADVMAWVAQHLDWLDADLVRDAVAAVERVRSASELRDLWSESNEFDAWYQGLDDLLKRLRD